MNYHDDKKKYVNGPINTIRMEGKIGNIKKVLYIFADVHLEPQNETMCDNIYSIEMKDYILNNIKNIDHEVDIFMEMEPHDIARNGCDVNNIGINIY